MALSKEELAELAELEKDETKRAEEAADAIQRQHIQALKLKRTLSTKHGACGTDFLVLETTAGNFAVRRPTDVDVDSIDETDTRASGERFVAGLLLFPDAVEGQKLMASFPALSGVLASAAMSLAGKTREIEAKK